VRKRNSIKGSKNDFRAFEVKIDRTRKTKYRLLKYLTWVVSQSHFVTGFSHGWCKSLIGFLAACWKLKCVYLSSCTRTKVMDKLNFSLRQKCLIFNLSSPV